MSKRVCGLESVEVAWVEILGVEMILGGVVVEEASMLTASLEKGAHWALHEVLQQVHSRVQPRVEVVQPS